MGCLSTLTCGSGPCATLTDPRHAATTFSALTDRTAHAQHASTRELRCTRSSAIGCRQIARACCTS
jgi:hypothetical protein